MLEAEQLVETPLSSCNPHAMLLEKKPRKADNEIDATDITVVNKFDDLPYPPAKQHVMVFEAFDELKPGVVFVFTLTVTISNLSTTRWRRT